MAKAKVAKELTEIEQLQHELGVPKPKWAVATLLDQTHGYFAEGDEGNYGVWTTQHPKACLYDTKEEAEDAMSFCISAERIPADEIWIEDVLDSNEFKAREDTW